MRYVFVFLLIVTSNLFCAPPTPKPALRALIVGDTFEPNRWPATVCDISNLQTSISTIAKTINFELKLTVLKDLEATAQNTENWLKSLPANPNDIVLFFYTGHGSFDTLDSPWPVIWPDSSGYGRGLSGSAIVRYLKKKPHRLTLVFFSCCNKNPIPPYDREIKEESSALLPRKSLPGIKQLF